MSPTGFAPIAIIGLLLLAACGSSGTPSPTLRMELTPASIQAGQWGTLAWSTNNASTCQATGAWAGNQSPSGSTQVSQGSPGTYTYTLDCSSGGSTSVTQSAVLTVTPAPLAITGVFGNGVIGTPFDDSIQATGGVAPFAWTVSSGALPHNLSLSPTTTDTVTVSGTPDTVAQGVTFTLQVTDAAHNTATQAFTISILLQADSLVLSPGSLTFANQILGSTSSALTETLTNTAGTDMLISNLTINPNQGTNAGEFTQSSTTCGSTLPAGANCAINVTFTPGQTGPRNAILTITDDTAGSPQSFGLNGVGLSAGPNATLQSASLDFGIQLVGTTSPGQLLALINYGAVPLNVGSVAATGSFAETDTCVPSLASGATCTIYVTFTPGADGKAVGALSVADDAAGSPQNVSLSGIGSTTTPLFTGKCYLRCGPVADPNQCPVGRQSRTPRMASGCPGGAYGGFSPGSPIDLESFCSVSGHLGHCQTE